MGWKLTPEERRIIERTKREGEEFYASETMTDKKKRTWKNLFIWFGVILLFVIGATFIYYIGTYLVVPEEPKFKQL